jgi:hypothetical protein
MVATPIEHGWWKFGGDNLQAQYGFGSECEAKIYLAYLNRDFDVNLYRYEYLGECDNDVEESQVGLVDISSAGFNLDAILTDIIEDK